MSNSTPMSDKSDLSQLRSLLFGEQAQQTDDRFEMLESSINALRRENRQLRQALEVEAMARIEADESQGSDINQFVDTSFTELSSILLAHVRSEQQKRVEQHQAMLDALAAMEQSQNDVTAKLIAHLQFEQDARAQQFAAMRERLSAESGVQSSVSAALADQLAAYAAKHEASSESVVELNGQAESS